MRKYLLLVVMVLYFGGLKAQQSVLGINSAMSIDSINYLLSQEKNDTIKVRLLNTLADKYLRLQKNDSVLWYAQQALSLSIKTNYLKGEFESRKWWPIILRVKGDYVNALKLALQNLQVAEKTNDPFIVLIGIQGVARTYNEMKDYNSQLKYNRKSKQIINSGYFKQEKDVKFKRLYFYLVMMGDAFEKLNLLDSAIYYMTNAYRTALELNLNEALALTTLNLGNIYWKLGKYDSAAFYYKIPPLYVEKMHFRYDLTGEAQLGLAKVFEYKNKWDSALYYSKLSLNNFHNIKYPVGEFETTGFLNDIYAKKNQFDSAYKYLSLEYILKDSLYNQEKTKQIEEVKYNEALKQQQMQQERKDAEQRLQTRTKTYSLIGGLAILVIIAFFLFRNNQQKQKANVVLNQKNEKIQNTLTELKATQTQLIQSEKMASLGELTAGIAHEIQNPLNFVNNFSDVSADLVDEMNTEIDKGNLDDAKLIAKDLKQNLEKINHHGNRAGDIVKGMLQHSRSSTGKKESTDINALADEYLRLAYHGLRAKDKSFNATMETEFDEGIGKINIISQDIGRVILNLINNAFYAVDEKRKASRSTKGGTPYEPTVTVTTKKENGKVEIKVKDNGNGIPQKVLDKIFQPFFTTKPTGQGTGLGLSLAYDIVKAHGGEIKVETKDGEGSEFIIQLSYM